MTPACHPFSLGIYQRSSDRAQLANVANGAKAVLQTDKLDAVADRGYFNGFEILACDRAGIAMTLPQADDLGREVGKSLRQEVGLSA